ncbi:hypothetical protein SC1_01425 [Sphingopyxis sp. C-1]|nr:hypothetical protein SC1_01425 [Sphingopyxis sp. C-1]
MLGNKLEHGVVVVARAIEFLSPAPRTDRRTYGRNIRVQ